MIKMNSSFEKLLDKYAEKALYKNRYNKACHVAFLLKNRKVPIKIGYNQMERQCFQGQEITSLHAEIDCLRQCRSIKAKNYTFLVVNISKDIKDGKIKYKDSRPCIHCTKFLKEVGFKHIYCSNSEGVIEKLSLSLYDPYTTSCQDKLQSQKNQ